VRLYPLALTTALFTGAASVSYGQVTHVGNAYKLRANYAKGSVIKFMSVNGVENKGVSSPQATVKVPVTLSILNKINGVATVKLTMGAIKLGDQVMQPENTTTFTLDPRNQTGDQRDRAWVPSFPTRPCISGPLGKMCARLRSGVQLQH